uniref:Uncharacterized protein n=1 Tax=Cajanus cajan TaxID=3821 RepID=A0A151TP78_CAJCA|nr:hypothetical protein KK1_022506 [Cajanus cajan]
MSSPTPEISDETLNPNTTEQCPPPPPQSPHPDPQTLTLSDPIPSLTDQPPPSPNRDRDTFIEDPIPTLTADDPEPAAAVVGGGAAKRAPKRKRPGHRRTAQERKFREKLQVIAETLKPIPFIPSKALDFGKHQSLLQRLGLWDFVHIEFDSALRCDLIAQLIASYVPNSRCSYVNGVRINVNRADLGRALRLPKKTSAGAAVSAAEAAEAFDLGEAVGFIEELVYNWMLLHDDAYMVTDDVLGCLSLIKEGNFEKVDWAGLIWNMVEKELKAPQLVSCYYAPHLQHLIKVQHEELLEAEVEVVEEENEVKEEGEEEDEEEESYLRPCHGSDVKDDHEHEGGFDLSAKCIPFEGMTSGNGSLIMEAEQMPFGSGIDLRDNPVGEFLSARDDPQMISGSSLFGNGHKRDNMGLDNHISHHSLNGSNKRMRSDSPWNSKQMDFESCMVQMEHLMGKARMMYMTKDQACEESTMNQQLLINELQKRDTMIEHLHKAKLEEIQKRQMEVYRFEKELYMMQSLVEGYRKALKETRKAFAEYRARCPQGDEPLYKDVPGSGGLVLTVMEVEKERLRKEAEERAKLRDFMRDFEKKCTDFESTWFGKFEGHMSSVESLSKRLLVVEDQVKNLNEVNAKRKASELTECEPCEPIECAPTTETTEGETA